MSTDGGVTLGMVLLHEAATSDMDVGKRKSKYYYFSLHLEGSHYMKIRVFNRNAFMLFVFNCEYWSILVFII